jgi:hypothetical protein
MSASCYAFVAVTTATDDGVATPSMGAGGGGITGGGVPPDGGVDVEPLPPQPAIASRTTQDDAANNERIDELPPKRIS